MRKRIFLPVVLIVNCALSFCNFGLCASYPQRIVSLCPAITEQLYLLGAEDKLIGCTIYCNRPPQAESKEKIGTVVKINLEKIVSLNPDLIIATPLSDPQAIAKLKDLGIKVAVFSSPENFAGLCSQFIELSRIVGREDEAEKLIRQIEAQVSDIIGKVRDLPKPKVFVQVGAKPLVTVTERSFINDFIKFAGGINVASSETTALYSREEVIRKNPDVILIVTMGIAGEKEMEIWKRYTTIEAVKSKRIYIVDSDKICSPTPLSFVQTLKELVVLLHSETSRGQR